MLIRSLLAFTLLIAWPFAGHAPALSESSSSAAAEPVALLSLWLDPRPLPPASDPAAEARVFEQTLVRAVELFLPVPDSSRTNIALAAAAFSSRKPLLLHVSGFESGSPIIEFVADTAQPETAAAIPHRRWAASQRGAEAGLPVFELFADINALRLTFESSFASGRAGRFIHALGAPNARSLMLHGRWITPDKVALFDPALPMAPAARRIGEYAKLNGPPLIRLDQSWNSRADEPSTIRGLNIAAGHWPSAQLKMSPPAAPFLCLFRADFRAWLGNALKVRGAWLDPESAAACEQSCAAWLRASRPSIDRISGSISSWLLLRPSALHPDLLIVQTPPKSDGFKAEAVVGEFDQLMRKQFPSRIEVIPDGGSRLPSPADWPLSVIFWNPNQATPSPTVQLRILLRGGSNDLAK